MPFLIVISPMYLMLSWFVLIQTGRLKSSCTDKELVGTEHFRIVSDSTMPTVKVWLGNAKEQRNL